MTEREKALQEFKYFKEMGYSHADLPSSGSIELAIAALESPRDWTPCAEGLPEKRKTCLITYACGEQMYIGISQYINERYGWTNIYDSSKTVLAWQPLPAPYRADDTTGKVKED